MSDLRTLKDLLIKYNPDRDTLDIKLNSKKLDFKKGDYVDIVFKQALRCVAVEWMEAIGDYEQYKKMSFADDFEPSCEQNVLINFIKYFFNID